ncbi:MAG: rhodanese-like domain-containing protein [Deltaproteobacteria bacterium]|nr:MAG: rhodanese-like domain-containing protein [Deltaproteobacteria bacterium]
MRKTLSQRWRSLLLGALGLLCVLLASLGTSLSLRWSLLRRWLAWEFSNVKTLSTSELAKALQQPKSKRPALLDVRKLEEYNISHLPGAKHVAPNTDPKELEKHYNKDQLLVVYCSVGYRSSKLAQRMERAGFQNVYNLEGSIFQWANEDRPLVKGEKPTQKVHPFDSMWGVFLKKSRRATSTPSTQK